MLRNTLAVLAVLALAVPSQAAIIISQEGVPTVNMAATHTTWTLTASSDNGDQIVGFDFASLPSYGFTGPMNQINPAGNATIFTDSNGFFSFVGADVSQDSQFKFNSGNLTVPSGFASESSNGLRAVFASGTPLGTSVPFVQLTIPNAAAATVAYNGTVTTRTSAGVFGDVPVAGVVPIPEPATIGLLGLAAAGFVGFRRRK